MRASRRLIRNEFDFPDEKITKADLAEIEVLIFSTEHCTKPINSLEDIKYFPNPGNVLCVGRDRDYRRYSGV